MNFLIPAILGTLILSTTAQQPTATSPAKPVRIAELAACPEPVRRTLTSLQPKPIISEILLTTSGNRKLYSFETGTEDDGTDRETTYTIEADGTLLRTAREIPLKDAPEPVRKAFQQAAGASAKVDDVEEVTSGTNITYRAELESDGAEDRRITVSPTGTVISLTPETDD